MIFTLYSTLIAGWVDDSVTRQNIMGWVVRSQISVNIVTQSCLKERTLQERRTAEGGSLRDRTIMV